MRKRIPNIHFLKPNQFVMKSCLLSFFLAFFLFQNINCQTFSKYIQLPNTTDSGWSVVPEEDGYTILASATFYTDTGFYFADRFLKTDLNGDLQWIKLIDSIPKRTNISGHPSLTRIKDSETVQRFCLYS